MLKSIRYLHCTTNCPDVFYDCANNSPTIFCGNEERMSEDLSPSTKVAYNLNNQVTALSIYEFLSELMSVTFRFNRTPS